MQDDCQSPDYLSDKKRRLNVWLINVVFVFLAFASGVLYYFAGQKLTQMTEAKKQVIAPSARAPASLSK